MNINNYYTIASGIFGAENKPDQEEYKKTEVKADGLSNVMVGDKFMELFYEALCEINSDLSDPMTTKEKALKKLEEYNGIMSIPGVRGFMSTTNNELSDKMKYIDESIQYYFLKKEMVTFGYFVDKMDIASKYSHNIGVRNYRDAFSAYTEFYKTLSQRLSSFGSYAGKVVSDGKETLFKYFKFCYDLRSDLMKYYPYTGDLKNEKGEECSLYKGKFEIKIDDGFDNCKIYIDDKLIDSGVSYSDAVKKMEYFFPQLKSRFQERR